MRPIGLLLLLLMSLPVQAATAVQDLGARLRALQSLETGFTQVTTQAGRQPALGTTGMLSAQRPGQFRWEVRQPYEQVIVSDGRELRVYDPDLMQMTVRPLGDEVAQTPALLFTGDPKAIAEQFDVQQTAQGKLTVFVLKPKARDAVFEQLQLRFDGATPVGMTLSDGVGQQTEVSFHQTRLNPRLPASRFRLNPPAGTDIIQE